MVRQLCVEGYVCGARRGLVLDLARAEGNLGRRAITTFFMLAGTTAAGPGLVLAAERQRNPSLHRPLDYRLTPAPLRTNPVRRCLACSHDGPGIGKDDRLCGGAVVVEGSNAVSPLAR